MQQHLNGRYEIFMTFLLMSIIVRSIYRTAKETNEWICEKPEYQEFVTKYKVAIIWWFVR